MKLGDDLDRALTRVLGGTAEQQAERPPVIVDQGATP